MDMHAGVPTGSSPLIEGDGYGAYYGEKPGNIGYNWNVYVDTVSYGKLLSGPQRRQPQCVLGVLGW